MSAPFLYNAGLGGPRSSEGVKCTGAADFSNKWHRINCAARVVRVWREVTVGKSTTNLGLSRRQFMKYAGAAAVLPNIIATKAWGATERAAPSNRITIGVIGVGGRARDDMRAFMALPDVQIVAVCDCFAEKRKSGAAIVNKRYNSQDCREYQDMHELLAQQDIDAVLIATGDNSHSHCAIAAARAGKDMYCEKPLSVCINESRAVADTMKRTGRIFQCGTQRRSLGNFRYAVHLAQSGKLGELKELHAEEASFCGAFNYEVLPEEPEPSKDVFDWNAWLGPAQWRPYNHKYPERGYWLDHIDFSGASICPAISTVMC